MGILQDPASRFGSVHAISPFERFTALEYTVRIRLSFVLGGLIGLCLAPPLGIAAEDEPSTNAYEAPAAMAEEAAFLEKLESIDGSLTDDEKVEAVERHLRGLIWGWRMNRARTIPAETTRLRGNRWINVYSVVEFGKDVKRVDTLVRKMDRQRLSAIDPYVLSRVLTLAKLETLEEFRQSVPAGEERSRSTPAPE